MTSILIDIRKPIDQVHLFDALAIIIPHLHHRTTISLCLLGNPRIEEGIYFHLLGSCLAKQMEVRDVHNRGIKEIDLRCIMLESSRGFER